MDNETISGRSFHNDAHFETGNDERGTPLDLARKLKRANGGRFDVDPASGCEPEPIGKTRFTIEDDGLKQDWFGSVWVNPPYSDIADWMEKCNVESDRDDVNYILALVPNRTSTQWFHNHATKAGIYCVIEGRLEFEHTDGSAPFPSAIFGYGDIPDDVMTVLHQEGAIYTIEENDTTDQLRFTELMEDGGEGETKILESDEVHELRSIGLYDEITLDVDTEAFGVPDVAESEPTVVVEAGKVRDGRQEFLTYNRDTEVWYMVMFPVLGDGRVSCAVEDPGKGWRSCPLNEVTLYE